MLSAGEWEPLHDYARERSRSPRNYSSPGANGYPAAHSHANEYQVSADASTQWYELPSIKLGQLLGFKGGTIQKVKEITGVSRLHIQEKERAKVSPIIYVEIVGQPQQVSHCQRVLDAICIGDQSELGHRTSYMPVETSLVGKLMGSRGQTVKEMTQVTGAYIEILQDAAQGVTAGPQLFISGPPAAVDWAEDLIARFLAAPGSRLDVVLQPGESLHSGGYASASSAAPVVRPPKPTRSLAEVLATLPSDANDALQALIRTLSGNGPPGGRAKIIAAISSLPNDLSATLGNLGASVGSLGVSRPNDFDGFEADLEETSIEVPARIKGHLLGLHGQTIELVRKTSGVVKCHLDERKGGSKGGGNCNVTILGPRDRVKACVKLIKGIIAGDHSGIGHSTTYVSIDRAVVGKIMGYKGQTVKELGQVTGCYIEIIQDDIDRPQLFLAGPPASVDRCVDIIARFIDSPGSRLEAVLGPGFGSQKHASDGTSANGDSASPAMASLFKALAAIPGLEGLSKVAENADSIHVTPAKKTTSAAKTLPPLEAPRSWREKSSVGRAW